MITACVISFTVGALIMMCAILLVAYQKNKKPRNNVHFYVTRDSDESIAPASLILWMGLPDRLSDMWNNSYNHCTPICSESELGYFGLHLLDFKDLKFEDEPVEVFLNLKD